MLLRSCCPLVAHVLLPHDRHMTHMSFHMFGACPATCSAHDLHVLPHAQHMTYMSCHMTHMSPHARHMTHMSCHMLDT